MKINGKTFKGKSIITGQMVKGELFLHGEQCFILAKWIYEVDPKSVVETANAD